MSNINTLGTNRRGGVALITALSMGALMTLAALAIDLGSIFLQSRQLQGMADLAAIGAARDLTNAQAAAAGTANANGWNGAVQTVVVVGTYTPDPTVPAGQRFVPGGANPNAAQVTLTGPANLFFGAPILGKTSINISRTATAASAQMASFSVGSGLLAVQGGVANAVLGGLTGSQVSLTAVDYNALVGAKVDLLQYSKALQTNLNLQGASFNQVLASKVTTGTALTVLASQLSTNGNDPAAQAVRKIATAAGTATQANLQNLIDLGPYADQDHTDSATGAGVQVSVMDLTSAMLQLSQGGHQVKLDLGANVPGLADVDVWLAIGARPSHSPWLTVNDDGSVTVSTAQARLYIDSKIAPVAGGLLGNQGVALVDIPIFVQAASAQAKLTSISCPVSPTDTAVTLSVEPSLGEVALGSVDTNTLNDFSQPVTINQAALVSAGILQVKGSAETDLGGVTWQAVNFSENDVAAGTIKSVSTGDTVTALAATLLPNAKLQAQLIGIPIPGLTGTSATNAVQSLLTTAAPPIDTVIDALSNVLGVQLGVADVRVDGLRCHDAALVS